jgi:hypothetical protein
MIQSPSGVLALVLVIALLAPWPPAARAVEAEAALEGDPAALAVAGQVAAEPDRERPQPDRQGEGDDSTTAHQAAAADAGTTPDTVESPGLAARAIALKSPVSFRSKGTIKALMMKFNRDLRYTLGSITREGRLVGVEATVVDVANGGKTTRGLLEIERDGRLHATAPGLINACNVLSIDPRTRARLLKEEGPVETRGQMESSGTVRDVTFSHRRVDEVAEDGSMRVETATTSDDGKVQLVTVTALAPDGLPWVAETSGTIAKGPVNLHVSLKLVRQDATDQPAGE